jgi:hypothetical protein
MFNRRFIIAAVAGATLVAAAPAAFAQGQATVGISTVTTYAADARITAVDTAKRTVTLAYSNGATGTRTVAPGVANFAQTKVGDMVSVVFEDRLTFVLSGPNVKTPADRDISATVVGRSGQAVGGATAGQTVASWWVTAVNPAANTISLVNPAGGEVKTFNVDTAAGREQLPRVKPGDALTVINSSVAVIGITPK